MKIIFLDIDGVLNNQQCLKKREFLSMELIEHLNKIQKATGAKIILSSTWRLGLTDDAQVIDSGLHPYLDQLIQIFRDLDIPLIGRTGRSDDYMRGQEILDWLEKHQDVENYVIIDDDREDIICYEQLVSHFVHTQTLKGLTGAQANKAIRILNH